MQGEILDIAVDLRKDSKDFLKVSTNILSDVNRLQIFIPKGFAHGFIALSDFALVSYKVDNYYHPKHEGGIFWNDPNLKIDYEINIDNIIISKKDKNLPTLSKLSNPLMKILVTGSNGQLGSELKKFLQPIIINGILQNVTNLIFFQIDRIGSYLTKINPNLIINCFAYTSVDSASLMRNLLTFQIILL